MNNVGRQKYLVPYYKAAIEMGDIDKAKGWLEANKNKYHSSTVKTISDLFPKSPTE